MLLRERVMLMVGCTRVTTLWRTCVLWVPHSILVRWRYMVGVGWQASRRLHGAVLIGHGSSRGKAPACEARGQRGLTTGSYRVSLGAGIGGCEGGHRRQGPRGTHSWVGPIVISGPSKMLGCPRVLRLCISRGESHLWTRSCSWICWQVRGWG